MSSAAGGAEGAAAARARSCACTASHASERGEPRAPSLRLDERPRGEPRVTPGDSGIPTPPVSSWKIVFD
ncbi:unnamed protein product [Arctia plantaginis]|uniref:Uncharacterized protein n=1 Tax=Arctia plantaginis TaxID=874455 RepID=A0A8S1AWY3_ARCPL|nr:unnamed protein product [Arctia plantaginis]